MAGIKQHYIPQFLQRGFASHKIGKISYVWEFRRDETPENAPVKEIGMEPHFYTAPNHSSLDDSITRAEQDFARLVHRLRDSCFGFVTDPEIPPFLAHVEVRTRHFRQLFLETGTYLLDRIVATLSDGEYFADIIFGKIERDPAYFRGMLEEQVGQMALSAREKMLAVELVMKESTTMLPLLRPEVVKQIPAFVHAIRNSLAESFKESAKNGHLKALSTNISPELRVRAYDAFRFRVVEVPCGGMIMGDSALLFITEEPRLCRSLTQKGQNDAAVILPLTPNKVLVGEKEPIDLDFYKLKRAIARCSLEFFLAHEDSLENRNLSAMMGEDAEMLSKSEIENMAADLFLNYPRAAHRDDPSGP